MDRRSLVQAKSVAWLRQLDMLDTTLSDLIGLQKDAQKSAEGRRTSRKRMRELLDTESENE